MSAGRRSRKTAPRAAVEKEEERMMGTSAWPDGINPECYGHLRMSYYGKCTLGTKGCTRKHEQVTEELTEQKMLCAIGEQVKVLVASLEYIAKCNKGEGHIADVANAALDGRLHDDVLQHAKEKT